MGHRDWGGSPFSFCVSAGKTQVSEAAGPPKKKRKRAQKKFREREEKAAEPKAQAPAEKSQARTPVAAKEREDEAPSSTGAPAGEGGGQGRLGSATDTKVGLSGHNGTIRSCETSRRARFQRTDHGAPVGGWESQEVHSSSRPRSNWDGKGQGQVPLRSCSSLACSFTALSSLKWCESCLWVWGALQRVEEVGDGFGPHFMRMSCPGGQSSLKR